MKHTVWNLFFPDQADHKTDDGHDSEQEKKNFGNFYSASSNATEAKHGCNQGDYQKYNWIMQHLDSFVMVFMGLRISVRLLITSS